jgi:hypothetical protein
MRYVGIHDSQRQHLRGSDHPAACLLHTDYVSSPLKPYSSSTHTQQHSFCESGNESSGRARAKPDGTRAETTFPLSPKRMSPFKSAGESVQSNAGSWGVRISGSNAGYTTFRGSVKSTGYPLHSSVSRSLSLPCITVCHHIPNAAYHKMQVISWLAKDLLASQEGLCLIELVRKVCSTQQTYEKWGGKKSWKSWTTRMLWGYNSR